MDQTGLPPETVTLIRSRISSVGELEILLLLQSNPSAVFSAVEITEKLRSNLDFVEKRLQAFVDNGLVAAPPPNLYQYGPRTPELESAVRQLAECYLLYRLRVIDTIYSPPKDQMRSFSDAFRLKKDAGRDG